MKTALEGDHGAARDYREGEDVLVVGAQPIAGDITHVGLVLSDHLDEFLPGIDPLLHAPLEWHDLGRGGIDDVFISHVNPDDLDREFHESVTRPGKRREGGILITAYHTVQDDSLSYLAGKSLLDSMESCEIHPVLMTIRPTGMAKKRNTRNKSGKYL